MQTIKYSDGSVNNIPELGDLVRLTEDQITASGWTYAHKGEWGKVVRIDKPGSCIAFLDIQLGGYSKSKEAFVQMATGVPAYKTEPYTE